ncbi:MAG: bifunctional (p)ppGpp synthetase/guanosine-3',5'-bis(diphosphate) 3'-pyrophosphohydrolase [Magnetococcales bacterium]|nr:bifunctional (p)ppGpp synthetase/guanosine-3',5'-bis(diphosphate) 3'-pyrophosphohydrolase [Magnetococcales bacterium]
MNAEQWSVLVDRILGYHPGADQALLERMRLFLEGISGQDPVTCRVGELDTPYEPLAVAAILVDLRLDVASIAAGLLVDALAASWITLPRIREEFGEDVAFLVERVSRISLLPARPKNTSQAEEFRKMILSMAKDIRVILVRLAICVWRMRHLAARAPAPLPVPRQAIQDIVEIQAPIAHRLGIYWIKNELEDLAFRLLEYETYESLKKEVAKRRRGGADLVQQVVSLLKKHLRRHGIAGQVLGREKHLWSIHSKLMQKNISLDEMYDLVGYRIIVKKKSDCYRVLGMIHGEFPPVPGRFKDYIALPKSNGYQSLHTVVIGPFGERIEVQIRNEKMHQVAESGVAAHWTYKERGGLIELKHGTAMGYEWLQRMLENHKKEDDVGKFVENVKIDLFPNEIYLFTPVGDVITLPVGATPVDFAYAVHSEVGDHCQGAKVNGRMVPLHTMLHTGDQVSILTSKSQRPNGSWLRFVVTSRAKYRINRWLKVQERERDCALGRAMLEREVRKVGRGAGLGEKLIRRAVEHYRLPDEIELMVRIARARLSALQVALMLFPGAIPERSERSGVEAGGEAGVGGGEEVHIKALPSRIEVRAARCCGPVPGDRIVGIISTGRGIMIHAEGCPNLTPLVAQPERWMEDLDWSGEENTRYRTRLRVMARNRREIITLVTQAVTAAKGGVASVHVWDRERDPCVLIVMVEVTGIEELNQAMHNLRALKEVFNVDRIRGG